MNKWARISDCGKFRYTLGRHWGVGPGLVFVMLNPSTADADIDDPTIRKCMGFARRLECSEGIFYGGIVVVNLFAYRATDPADLKRALYPVGPDNDHWILESILSSRPFGENIVCAWGRNAAGHPRTQMVIDTIRKAGMKPMALRLSADGTPHHPLMLPYSCSLIEIPS